MNERSASFSLQDAVDAITSSRERGLVAQMRALDLDPVVDFAGGDWRYTDFRGEDLRHCSFRNARLFGSTFTDAKVLGADFRGASDVHRVNLHLAVDWRKARFEPEQIVLIEARLATPERKSGNRLGERDWVKLIHACGEFADAEELLMEMADAGFPLNAAAFTSVMDKAMNNADVLRAVRLFEHFRADGGVLDLAMFTARINLATSAAIAIELFDELLAAGFRPDERAFNALISKQRGEFYQALDILNNMTLARVRVTNFTAYALFDVCETFNQAVEVLIRMRRAGLRVFTPDFIWEMRCRTRDPALTDINITRLREDFNSPERIVSGLITRLLPEPRRSECLRRLAIPKHA